MDKLGGETEFKVIQIDPDGVIIEMGEEGKYPFPVTKKVRIEQLNAALQTKFGLSPEGASAYRDGLKGKVILGFTSTHDEFHKTYGWPAMSYWTVGNEIRVGGGSIMLKPSKIPFYEESYFFPDKSVIVYSNAEGKPFLIRYLFGVPEADLKEKFPPYDQSVVDSVLKTSKADDSWKIVNKSGVGNYTYANEDFGAGVLSQNNELREICIYNAATIKKMDR